MIKLGSLNIRFLSTKALFVNDMITHHKLDVLCLTETWLKPDEYIILNESAPQDYCYKHEPRPKGKGGDVATIYSNTLSISQKTGFKYNSFEVMVLHITLYITIKYGRNIASTTKDCFVSNLPDLSQFLSISNSVEKLDDVTETMDSLF